MCGRAALSAPPDDLREIFGVDDVPELLPRFNIAPTQPVAVVRVTRAGSRRIELARWGLVPHWAKDARIGARMINARSETLETNNAFRDAFHRRRCLVAVSGFYEWKDAGSQGAGKKGRSTKIPYFVRRTDGKPFALGGLWERWGSPSGELVDSASVITVPSRGALATLHDRMPLIVLPEDFDRWLAREELAGKGGDALATLHEAPLGDFVTYAVGPHVNDVSHEDPECIAPAEGARD
jgi:putative SOS response-associated peptidase YedK